MVAGFETAITFGDHTENSFLPWSLTGTSGRYSVQRYNREGDDGEVLIYSLNSGLRVDIEKYLYLPHARQLNTRSYCLP